MTVAGGGHDDLTEIVATLIHHLLTLADVANIGQWRRFGSFEREHVGYGHRETVIDYGFVVVRHCILLIYIPKYSI